MTAKSAPHSVHGAGLGDAPAQLGRGPIAGVARQRGALALEPELNAARVCTLARLSGVCCVGGKQTRFSAVLPRSDGVGEFGEDCCESMPWVGVHAEFVVAASEVLEERVSGTDHLC